VSSSAQYIIQHFRAATGCKKLEGTVKNVFTTGKVAMDVVDELGSTTNGGNNSEKGCFVMWQMVPDKWQIELVLGGQKVLAGSNGAIAWRHTPWLGVHAAKGGVRPLRRALQASSSSSSSSPPPPSHHVFVLNFPTDLVLCVVTTGPVICWLV